MKNNRKLTKRLLVLYCICAVLWSAVSIMKYADGITGLSLWLPVFCAVIWTGLFIVMIRRYRKQNEETEQ